MKKLDKKTALLILGLVAVVSVIMVIFIVFVVKPNQEGKDQGISPYIEEELNEDEDWFDISEDEDEGIIDGGSGPGDWSYPSEDEDEDGEEFLEEVDDVDVDFDALFSDEEDGVDVGFEAYIEAGTPDTQLSDEVKEVTPTAPTIEVLEESTTSEPIAEVDQTGIDDTLKMVAIIIVMFLLLGILPIISKRKGVKYLSLLIMVATSLATSYSVNVHAANTGVELNVVAKSKTKDVKFGEKIEFTITINNGNDYDFYGFLQEENDVIDLLPVEVPAKTKKQFVGSITALRDHFDDNYIAKYNFFIDNDEEILKSPTVEIKALRKTEVDFKVAIDNSEVKKDEKLIALLTVTNTGTVPIKNLSVEAGGVSMSLPSLALEDSIEEIISIPAEKLKTGILTYVLYADGEELARASDSISVVTPNLVNPDNVSKFQNVLEPIDGDWSMTDTPANTIELSSVCSDNILFITVRNRSDKPITNATLTSSKHQDNPVRITSIPAGEYKVYEFVITKDMAENNKGEIVFEDHTNQFETISKTITYIYDAEVYVTTKLNDKVSSSTDPNSGSTSGSSSGSGSGDGNGGTKLDQTGSYQVFSKSVIVAVTVYAVCSLLYRLVLKKS